MKNINYSPQIIKLNVSKPYYNYSNVLNISPINLFQPKLQNNANLSRINSQNIIQNNYNEMNRTKFIPNPPTLSKNYSTPFININQLNANKVFRPISPIINNLNLNSNSFYINNNNNNNSFYNFIRKNNNGNIFYSPQKETNINTGLNSNLQLNTTSQHSHYASNQINQNNYFNKNINSNEIKINFIYSNQKYFVNNNERIIQPEKILPQFSPIKKEITQESTDINTQSIQSNELLTTIKIEEPKEIFEPNEFINLKRIGEGTYGKIYLVQWKKNNQKFAMKKEKIKGNESLKKNKAKTNIVKNFIKNTGSKGVIKIYADLSKKKGNEFYYYVLMELAEKDWEKELFDRQRYKQYYKEKELFVIMKQLISTLSLLQKNHITHRDIKPQNILISKGFYKISDFGEARVLIREGIIVSRVRGTELYMSPILFNGLILKLSQISHNTFKSDVFSLGMCLFFACTLTLNSLCDIRELNDMKLVKDQLLKYLSNRYSFKLINILYEMLQLDENNRPDFITLEKKYFS